MNPKNPTFDPSRRKFVGACCSAVTATGMLSTLAQLRLMGAVATPDGSSSSPPRAGALPADFKALVCLFLAGGNDANNMVVPFDTAGYAAYASPSGRGALALPRTQLLGIAPQNGDGREWALHSSLNADVANTNNTGLKSVFDGGKMAVIANVGTLIVPTTKAQYTGRTVPLPPQLFSHNDQQVEWQSSVPDKPFATGWGGRLADLTNAFNANNSISMSISLNGQNSFQVGKNIVQFAVNPGTATTSGAIALSSSSGGTATGTNAASLRMRAQNELLAQQNGNLFETAFAGLTSNAISDSALLSSILSANPPFTTAFSTSALGNQLRTIARLIAAAPQLGLKRQIYFARIGGFDLHDTQLTPHANLFADISRNVAAFYRATVELGCADQVTTFTASDFGRTYNTNGDGSDHGWGSHHFVVGGAVKGGNFYGKMPDLTINGPDDTGRGRWIPTTSVDEYSATLASWFGVSATNLPVVLPNIGRFANPNLGFV
jgi:uncharacterized protein (DUF1501 family)